MSKERLSEAQRKKAAEKALRFREEVEQQSRAKGFAEAFRIASIQIEADVDRFCDRAQEIFDEIEAFGQEPQLDDDWLSEVTGEKDNFYFSTESLVQDTPKLPSQRGRPRKIQPDERDVVLAVEEAVQSLEEALNVSHSEDVKTWVQKVSNALQKNHQCSGINFWHLQNMTKLQPAALWLTLLLGHQHWIIEQDKDDFYGSVTIKTKD